MIWCFLRAAFYFMHETLVGDEVVLAPRIELNRSTMGGSVIADNNYQVLIFLLS